METVPVVIVGAGPSGLAMGLSLAKYGVKSMILEQQLEITQDPRAVYLNGDAVRILWNLGVREQFKDIGHPVETLNFHRSSLKAKPFYALDTTLDLLQQALPNGIAHVQPKLESAMVDLINSSEFCTLRRGCTVESHEMHPSHMTIEYQDQHGKHHFIDCSWLIGADGKRGIVRKYFLEPDAGIKQVDGRYTYEGTWVAANLKITAPTPGSHPELPFWKMGMNPNDVYDLYWPDGWHFCNPPGKPTAGGRIGPQKNRFWRWEFAELKWDDSMDAEALLWEHLTPMLTRNKAENGTRFPNGAVTFPRDCIEIWRCRPFTFCQKAVNKWSDRRRILIGDAAHVFPPFGGEGMSSGLRDAHQLAWRIAMAESIPNMAETTISCLLSQWEAERRRGIDDAVTFTKINGTLCNEPESWGFFVFRHLESIYKMLPFIPKAANGRTIKEAKGFIGAKDGFFLREFGGGGKLAQVFVESDDGKVFRSDELLRSPGSLLTILVSGPDSKSRSEEAVTLLQRLELPSTILSPECVVALDQHTTSQPSDESTYRRFRTTTPKSLDVFEVPKDYDPEAYLDRMGPLTRYAILRPDNYIFALLKSMPELEQALITVKERLERPM